MTARQKGFGSADSREALGALLTDGVNELGLDLSEAQLLDALIEQCTQRFPAIRAAKSLLPCRHCVTGVESVPLSAAPAGLLERRPRPRFR